MKKMVTFLGVCLGYSFYALSQTTPVTPATTKTTTTTTTVTPASTVPTVSTVSTTEVPLVQNGPEAGRWFLFGTVGYHAQKSNGVSSKQLEIAPGLGYFISDPLALGINFTYRKSMGKDSSGNALVGFNAFAKYYFTRAMLGTRGGIFLQGDVGVTSYKPAYLSSRIEPGSVTGMVIGIHPGFAIFPTRKICFEFSLPNVIAFRTTSPSGTVSGNSFDIGFSTYSAPSVTFLYFFK